MDLVTIVRENPRARAQIMAMNLAEISRRFGITFSEARELQNLAALLDCGA